jgi:Spy/CpxP family protein refolding chaperone
MKKGHWLAFGAAVLISLTGFTPAEARQGGYNGPGYGNCKNCEPQGRQNLSTEELQAREEFRQETSEIRRQMAVKQAELQALMAQTNPDEKKVAALTGEVWDLRNGLRQKAVESGLPGQFGFENCRKGGMRGGRGPQARNSN